MYKIVYTKQAIKDIQNLKDAKLDKKAKEFIEIMKVNPYQIPPPIDLLKGNLKGTCSRRINIQHRLIYQVYEEEMVVKILNMWTI